MGTDIYLEVEKREATGWKGLRLDLPEPRNQLLFAMLAGVGRCWEVIEPIAKPRGLPGDASPEVRSILARHAKFACCLTYVSFRELLDWDWSGKTYQGRTYADWASNFLPEAIPKLEGLNADPADVRLIIYFDNGEPNPWIASPPDSHSQAGGG